MTSWPTPLKNDGASSSVGMMTFPIWWESHKIPWFQTTNQSYFIENQQVVSTKFLGSSQRASDRMSRSQDWQIANARSSWIFQEYKQIPSGKLTVRPWQIEVGRLVSIKNWWFSGSMLIYWRVVYKNTHFSRPRCLACVFCFVSCLFCGFCLKSMSSIDIFNILSEGLCSKMEEFLLCLPCSKIAPCGSSHDIPTGGQSGVFFGIKQWSQHINQWS